MQGANRECGCGRSGKDEFLAEDEVFPQRNSEEDTEVTTCKGQRQKLAKVTRWGAEQTQLVQSGNGRYLLQFDYDTHGRTAEADLRKESPVHRPLSRRSERYNSPWGRSIHQTAVRGYQWKAMHG